MGKGIKNENHKKQSPHWRYLHRKYQEFLSAQIIEDKVLVDWTIADGVDAQDLLSRGLFDDLGYRHGNAYLSIRYQSLLATSQLDVAKKYISIMGEEYDPILWSFYSENNTKKNKEACIQVSEQLNA